MSRLEDKSNNEILLDIKQLQADHASLKLSLVKDYDIIQDIKGRMKRDWEKVEDVEAKFAEANGIILRRLKGEI